MDKLENEMQNILIEWDPLGDDKWKIEDLDNYKTEAMDIFSELHIMNVSSEKSCIRLVRDTISQAFDIDVSIGKAEIYGKRIWEVFLKNKKIEK